MTLDLKFLQEKIIKMRSTNRNARKNLQNSLKAFLEGEENCTLQWIKGIIGQSGLEVEDLLEVFQICKQYGDERRYRQIFEICHAVGFDGHLIN